MSQNPEQQPVEALDVTEVFRLEMGRLTREQSADLFCDAMGCYDNPVVAYQDEYENAETHVINQLRLCEKHAVLMYTAISITQSHKESIS